MLYVGTSGWAYREWKPDFYPEDLPQRSFLEHYSSKLGACEINATFYRLQSQTTFEKWAQAVPERFRFSVKAHRRLTHSRSIRPDDEQAAFLKTFIESLAPLRTHLGAVLFQLPPYRKRSDDDLAALLEAIPADLPLAFEFRDASWQAPEVAAAITARGATLCFSDTSGEAPAGLAGGDLGYVRLRHDRYTEEQRARWLGLLRAESGGRDVFAFAKHEGTPTDDPFGGIGLATWLWQETAP
ncbi:MAG: hypothetical protein QOK47_1066 [Actinomycetota bacterium]|nr:hypothetical protein [Actinomycetota bacterium]